MTSRIEYSVDDLQKGLRRAWQESGLHKERAGRPGLAVAGILRESRKRNRAIPFEKLELWFAVLDELISWYVSLFTITMFRLRRGRLSRKQRDVLRCCAAISARIASDLLSVRLLCEAGFDVAAKTIVRSTVEYIDVLAYLSLHPELASKFRATQDNKRSNSFWRKHVKGGGPNGSLVRQALTEAIVGKGVEPDEARRFVDWFYSGSDILLMSSHPSFSGAFFSNIVLGTPEDDLWLGIFGAKGEVSVGTIHVLMKHVFKFLVVIGDAPFRVGSGAKSIKVMNYKPNDEFHRHVRLGAGTLMSLYALIGDPRMRDAFFGRKYPSSLEQPKKRPRKRSTSR
ncbi:MAG: hypothetical protein ACK4TP_15975 [Hyphomicrobium sp.]